MIRTSTILIAAAIIASPAVAQERVRATQFQALVSCRALTDGAQRLACFDREAAAIDAAEARRDIVVVDRQQLRSTRRQVFGLTLPAIPFFNDDKDGNEEEAFVAPIKSVRTTRDGKWVIGFAEAIWQATEVSNYQDMPRVGEAVTIRRGPLGSYKMSVAGRSAVRATRLR